MCILLAEFLRMTLGLGEKSSIPLSEELSLVHRFLAIEKVRFGSRLQMTEDVAEECKTMLVPPLLLQPLIENAVTHGIANLPDGGSFVWRQIARPVAFRSWWRTHLTRRPRPVIATEWDLRMSASAWKRAIRSRQACA